MTRSGFLRPRYIVAFAAVATASGFAAVAIAGAVAVNGHRPVKQAQPVATARVSPTAADFAAQFLGVTNQYAREHGDRARASHARCVQASARQYMCTYLVAKPGAAAACHLMQGRWTPELASTITVTLSGRTSKCSSLREAIRTLR